MNLFRLYSLLIVLVLQSFCSSYAHFNKHKHWELISKKLVKNFNAKDVLIGKLCKVWIDQKTLTHILDAHSDFNGLLRKDGYLKIKKITPHGFYVARVWNGEVWRQEKTFFPEDMPPDEILNRIRKTLSTDFLQLEERRHGRFLIEHDLLDKVALCTVLESSGQMVSSFPKIRN